jgi:hypothetical protein
MILKNALFAMVALAVAAAPVRAAEDEHDHAARTFAHARDGVAALAEALSDARAKVAAGRIEALHETAEALHGIGEGLKERTGDVAQANRQRFAFNADQVLNLHEQLEAAHDTGKADEVNRVLARLEAVHGRLAELVGGH